jgi:hypothetical protein
MDGSGRSCKLDDLLKRSPFAWELQREIWLITDHSRASPTPG